MKTQRFGDRVLDFAMDGIACFAIRQSERSRYAILRVLWMLIHFPWLILTAAVWLPLEVTGFLIIMFSDAWRGTR